MAPFIKKQGRHSWNEEHIETCITDLKLVPPLPTHDIRADGQKLFKCQKCDWWRVTAKSARGNDNDFFYYRPGQRHFSWSSFFIHGRPKCGEVKR